MPMRLDIIKKSLAAASPQNNCNKIWLHLVVYKFTSTFVLRTLGATYHFATQHPYGFQDLKNGLPIESCNPGF